MLADKRIRSTELMAYTLGAQNHQTIAEFELKSEA